MSCFNAKVDGVRYFVLMVSDTPSPFLQIHNNNPLLQNPTLAYFSFLPNPTLASFLFPSKPHYKTPLQHLFFPTKARAQYQTHIYFKRDCPTFGFWVYLLVFRIDVFTTQNQDVGLFTALTSPFPLPTFNFWVYLLVFTTQNQDVGHSTALTFAWCTPRYFGLTPPLSVLFHNLRRFETHFRKDSQGVFIASVS